MKINAYFSIVQNECLSMTILQNLKFQIEHIGYSEKLSEYEKKRIVVFNILNFAGLLLALLRSIYTFLFSPAFFSFATVFIDAGLAAMFLFLFLLISRQYYKTATIASFATIPLLLTLSSLTTPESGTEIYLILYMMLAFFFLHKTKNIIVSFLYSLLLYVGLRIYVRNMPAVAESTAMSGYTIFNYFGAFLMIFLTMYMIKFQVWKYERSIKAKKELLRITNKKILVKTALIEEQSALLHQKNLELTELNTIKIKLFSIISHDVRTSVYALKNIMDAFAKGTFSKEDMMQNLPGVNSEVDKCAELIDNLLSWARNQLNESKVTPTRIDLNKIAARTFTLYSKKAADKAIQFINNVQPGNYAYADVDMIKTVVRNLVGNALKFTNAGGIIEINTETNPGNIVLLVKDNGIGITEAGMAKIFSEKYYTTLGTDKEMGTGLGLMICRDFIKSNKGELTITSKHSAGACFAVTLPVKEKICC